MIDTPSIYPIVYTVCPENYAHIFKIIVVVCCGSIPEAPLNNID